MKIHLQREIEELKKRVFNLSALVEESLELSIKAVLTGDVELAESITKRDLEIDRLEVEVEEECLKILALHQPVAVDLRFLIAALKMNNDLERIGDLAVNISRGRACMVENKARSLFGEEIRVMGVKARQMLRDSLEGLMHMNIEGARAVLAADDEVDALYYDFVARIKTTLLECPQDVENLLCWMMLAKHIERVADLATNIAEDTIYTVDGTIVRHSDGH